MHLCTAAWEVWLEEGPAGPVSCFGRKKRLAERGGFYPRLSSNLLKNLKMLSMINNWSNLQIFSSVSAVSLNLSGAPQK